MIMASSALNGRQVPPPTPNDPSPFDPSRVHHRDFTGSRGRITPSAKASISSTTSGSITSPSLQSSATSLQSSKSGNTTERRPSLSYSHARQPSKAPSQPRNAYVNPSPATSPMSPEIIDPGPDRNGVTTASRHTARWNLQRRPSNSVAHHVHGGSQNQGSSASSTLPARDAPQAFGGMPLKKSERLPTTSNKHETGHHHSHSRAPSDQKTVGEYSLHHLFNKFLPQADLKIKHCIMDTRDQHHDSIVRVCGPGADVEFDNLINAMAYITRRRPKPLVDTIMYWRQQRARGSTEMASEPVSNQFTSRESQRRAQEDTKPSPLDTYQDESSYDESPYNSEYRLSVAIYLTCRVLIEVFYQAEPLALSSSMHNKLVGIIFERLRLMDPNSFTERPFERPVWDIYGQLLGVMDLKRPRIVTHLFVKEVESIQKDLFTHSRTLPSKEVEYRTEMLIRSMRHFQTSIGPEHGWQETCDFLKAVAGLANDAHGAPIKQAYCNVLVDFLIPIASRWSSSLDTAQYRDFHRQIFTRVQNLTSKARHWSEAVACYSLLLCASSDDQLVHATTTSAMNTWQTKLKDRATRATALQAITRLVWTFHDRKLDPQQSATKRVEDILKIVLPTSKRTATGLDIAACEPLVELIRIIGYHNQEYCLQRIIPQLLNAELFKSGKDIRVEQLDPERIVVGIRAFLLILRDCERQESGKPPFPAFGRWHVAMNPQSQQHSSSLWSADKEGLSFISERPITVSKLTASCREHYKSFCEILGKITIICDNAFGGQAVLDEKFSGHTPKTPASDQFSFRMQKDEHQIMSEQRPGFYELLHVAVQALPQSLSTHVQIKPLINLLCTCTAHVQSNIASSSIQSLKSIARQAFAQPVTIGFARFIFNFDARYSTMSEEGLLGPGHIENTLNLYVELLQIWIEEITFKMREAATEIGKDSSSGVRGRHLDLTSVTNHVDEVESHGVFFLCSQSRRVRAFAVKVLKIVTEFDTALGRTHPRIIQILEGDTQRVMNIEDNSLTVAERSRLMRGRAQGNSQATLIELSSSDDSYDSTLWLKVFPNIIRNSFELCPSAVMFGREIVCARLLQMQGTISFLDDPQFSAPGDLAAVKGSQRLQSTSPQVIIEQWKLYLIMACTTVTSAGAQTQSQLDKTQHIRKISKPASTGQDKISSARALFAHVIPLLGAQSATIREAIVLALSSINTTLYRVLLESLQYPVTTCKEEAKKRIGSHHRSVSNSHEKERTDRMRTEVTQIYRLTARFLQEQSILQDEWIVNNLSTYARELMIFLGDAEVQSDWDSQKLRRQFCGLVEELSNGINHIPELSRYISFAFRKSAFSLMEDWCGHSPNPAKTIRSENYLRQVSERYTDPRAQGQSTASAESEKRDLSVAALSAMATLCAGPMKVTTDRGEALSFDRHRMLSWVDQIFNSQNDRMHVIGQRALYNLIEHNMDMSLLLGWAVDQCFITDRPRALESYFTVAAKLLYQHQSYQVSFWRILAALLFLLGNEKSEIRIQAVKLLQELELRRHQNSRIRDFDINISDRTTAVYKLASYEISSRLAQTHADLSFHVMSQFSCHFRKMGEDIQRQMVSLILPWIQMIELQIDMDGKPTAQSYTILVNLLEITLKTNNGLHNEVQALWQALATGHPGNVQLVLDFVIAVCSERKDQAIVYYAKQIIVYMAHGAAASKVVEYLLMKITPKNMVHSSKDLGTPLPEVLESVGLPYTASLTEALPSNHKTDSFALAHLAIVFLVDLIVKPMTVKADQVPLLLHVIFVLWDHQIELVQEQARELLVHLIHELIITKIPDEMHDVYTSKRGEVEAFVDAVRHHEPSVIWQYRERVAKYEDWNADHEDEVGDRVPPSMPKVTGRVIEIFGLLYPTIQDGLARISLGWGTSCPVRHAACRSLQIFRCVLVPIDHSMLSDILARISNTIVHEAADVQAFSMEMLTTVKSIVAALEPLDLLQFPHLFWTNCACLDTVIENEFVAALGMLNNMLPKLNFDDPAVIKILETAKPKKWHGLFEGLTPLVYKGLKSETSLRTSLQVLDVLIALPDNDLIGNQSRLLFVTLANLPRFMQYFEDPSNSSEAMRSAEILAAVADAQGKQCIALVLQHFCEMKYANCKTFLGDLLGSLRNAYFPMWELKVIIFVIGLLTNKLDWYKLHTLEIVKALLTDVDTHRAEISNYGPDLISPLLRLLQTEHCPQAIEVLDHVNFTSETPLTKQHLRMSMTGLGSRSLPVRKEYERTQSLYGIPEETGWSIPMPGIHTSTTRANMASIYQECANPSAPAVEAVPTPEVEFHPEEELEQSYFAVDRNGAFGMNENMMDQPIEGGMSDLLTKLNSLDDFFDETLDTEYDFSARHSTLTITPYNLDTGAQIYDRETAPILQRTLGRTVSISSMHNHVAEGPKTVAMSPAAFTPPTDSTTAMHSRPTLHARSVTSPANNITRVNRTLPEPLSDDDGEDGILSEDERATGHTVVKESRLLGSTSLRRAHTTLRKTATSVDHKETGQRSLLRSQSRSHGHNSRSPSVPKVPEAYRR